MWIENGCVKLRAIEEKDVELLYFLINSPEIEKMTGGWHSPINMENQRNWIAGFSNSEKDIRLMIELENGYTIGMIMLKDIDWKNRTASIEYKMNAPVEHRMKGDMKAAVDGMLSYAFNELGLNCIIAKILDYNHFSLKLIKKAGFKEEGLLRQRVYKGGAYHDQIILSLLRGEFLENTGQAVQ